MFINFISQTSNDSESMVVFLITEPNYNWYQIYKTL